VAIHFDDPLEEWEKCVNINLTSLMRVTYLALPHLEKKTGGAIINLASDLGREPSGRSVPCTPPPRLSLTRTLTHAHAHAHAHAHCTDAASKHGVVGFSLSMFEAVREKGIKVCSIEPGYVDTPMPSGDHLDRKKMIRPEDIALTVAFVAKVRMRASASAINPCWVGRGHVMGLLTWVRSCSTVPSDGVPHGDLCGSTERPRQVPLGRLVDDIR
jgi:NAD(P)-dependent dehydrogenase (short-subunit alcohol dehydrogenase family)